MKASLVLYTPPPPITNSCAVNCEHDNAVELQLISSVRLATMLLHANLSMEHSVPLVDADRLFDWLCDRTLHTSE